MLSKATETSRIFVHRGPGYVRFLRAMTPELAFLVAFVGCARPPPPAFSCPGDAGSVGDPDAWATLTTGPFACTKNSDCCVIVNECTDVGQIVSAANKSAAEAAWPYCPNSCALCFPPAVQVGCVDGLCTGSEIFADAGMPWPTSYSHCGIDTETVPPGVERLGCGTQ